MIRKKESLVPFETQESLVFLLFPLLGYFFPHFLQGTETPIQRMLALLHGDMGNIPLLPSVSHQFAEGRHLLVYQLYDFKERNYCLHPVLVCSNRPSHWFWGETPAPCSIAQIMYMGQIQQLSLGCLILWCSSQKADVKKKK